MGIVDPTKVTCTALQNAASIASLILTADVMIASLPEKKEAAFDQINEMGMQEK